ncbi:uncharacterized protein [Clytia hemisphaerica]|uniref:uncharacterized protein n=1 Tax=Clytia hemisphaerica TaxID=252671 RepID=UPI0034D5FD19|eukprot:TCONS_00029264-protein
MSSNLKLEKTKFPTADYLESILSKVGDWDCLQYLAGDKIVFEDIEPKGFEIVETSIPNNQPKQEDEDCEEDEEEDDDDDDDDPDAISATMKLRVAVKTKEEKIKEMFSEAGITVKKYKIISSDSSHHDIEASISFDYCSTEVIESSFLDMFWKTRMNAVITEGVCYSNSKVPDNLRDSLRNNIDKLANETEIDFHPNSNDVVRDLVHPALYSYIKGVSKLKKLPDVDPPTSKKSKEESEKDFWGRPYEDSKFQWLPTPFHVSEDGKCSIKEYINNLDKDKFPEMYDDLEKLFEVFLPYFEEVWAYSKTMEFWQEDSDEDVNFSSEESFKFSKPDVKFRDQELQVITKIVDYTLQPGQSYEGVWHAEGMSHENIVMTGLYFIDRDADLTGGDLRFKRAFHIDERAQVFWNVPQERPVVVNQFASEAYIPLGHFPTKEGYIMIFPNCHIHKIAKFVNESKTKAASRRIVVFFFVNPEKKIISTREVAPQQGVIRARSAKKFRLDLMTERKYNKDKLNVRELELCEH